MMTDGPRWRMSLLLALKRPSSSRIAASNQLSSRKSDALSCVRCLGVDIAC